MPAKKKAKATAKKKPAAKKSAKPSKPKKTATKTAKKTVKKATKKAAATTTKTTTKKKGIAAAVKDIIAKAPARPKPAAVPEPPEAIAPAPPPPPHPPKKKLGIDCEHCDATGVCAAGEPYDKSHGQMFGAKMRITSCVECLEAAGEHKNSKKLVPCRICGGDGKV